MSAQISYYNQLIGRRADWTLAGIYSDEGLSGTKDDRDEFLRLLEDCRARKIDLVLTKSISRFARNTVTLLETVRELKKLGVDVYFERENIHSLSSDGEVMLTILASYAQEESRSVSENGKWRIRKRFEQGDVFQLQPVYGYQVKHGKYIIDSQQAEVVKWIFESYATGMLPKFISQSLNERGVPTFWNAQWNRIILRNIILNSFYTGQVMLQRYFVEDHLTKKLRQNTGELPRYIVSDHHPAIVTKDLYDRVQIVFDSRRPKTHSKTTITPFSGIITCGNCGKHFARKTINGVKKWLCQTYEDQGRVPAPPSLSRRRP